MSSTTLIEDALQSLCRASNNWPFTTQTIVNSTSTLSIDSMSPSSLQESMEAEEGESEQANDQQPLTYELRPYQEKLVEKALDHNSIVVLPTGTGKTMIAITLIKKKLHETFGVYPGKARRTIFVAPTRQLVDQQWEQIDVRVPVNVGRIHGDKPVSFTTKEEWNQYFQENNVIIFTPQVLGDIISKNFIQFNNINLIIFDEAHWVLKKNGQKSLHAYRSLIDKYKYQTAHLSPVKKPRILCLTASVFNSQVNGIDPSIAEIQEIFEANIETDEIGEFYKEAKVFVDVSDNSNLSIKLEQRKNSCPINDRDEFTKVLTMLEELEKQQKNTKNLAKSLRKAIDKVFKLCYLQMGPWFAIEALNIYISSWSPNSSMELGATLISVFEYFQGVINRAFRPDEMNDVDFALSTDLPFKGAKIKNLLSFLVIFRSNLNCIIFVKERLDANLLYRWLLFISEKHPSFGFIKPGFICGSSSKDFVKFDRNTANFKKKFEDGKLNVMISTAVLEEGIDVPICNVVIRYDFPENFRAFVQSKGRARDADSFYILMVDGKIEVHNWKAKLDEYNKTEQWLLNLAKNSSSSVVRLIPDAVEREDVHALQRFITKGGAELNEPTATGLLTRYLQSLPADYFTESQACFIVLTKMGVQPDTKQEVNKFCALFILPINSTLIGIVKGEYRANKKDAKRNCAFKVCKMLYEKGEFDEHLNLISKDFLLSKHFEELNLKVADRTKATYAADRNLQKAVYARIGSLYCERLFSSFSVLDKPVNLYLYSIDFPEQHQLFGESVDQSIQIGILTEQKFPFTRTESFIYLNQNRMKFTIQYNHCYHYPLSSNSLQKIRFFHRHIVQHVLVQSRGPSATKVKSDSITLLETLPDESRQFYLVPVKHMKNQNMVHFELIEQLYQWHVDLNAFHSRTNKQNFTNCNSVEEVRTRYPKDTLFSSFHKTKIVILVVREVSTDMFPTTEFEWSRTKQGKTKEDVKGTFFQFYKEMYNFVIEKQQLPMIRAVQLDSIVRRKHKFSTAYKVPRQDRSRSSVKEQSISDDEEEKSKSNHSSPHQLFPPEFALKYPLSLTNFLMFNAFPPILYRLEQYLIAHEFLEQLSKDTSVSQLYDDDIKPDTLLTAKTYANQSSTEPEKKGTLQKNNRVISVDENAGRADYQLVDIDNIHANEVTHVISSTEQNLVETLSTTLGGLPQANSRRGDSHNDNLDELLLKLRAVLPMAVSRRIHQVPFNRINESLGYGSTSLYCFTGRINDHYNITFNTFDYIKYPNPWYVVKAFTLSKACDIWNLEQLETVGDAFLKMTTATYLYFRYMNYDEGKLSQLKTALVSNENLYKLALGKNLQQYIVALEWRVGETWMVPFYETAKDVRLFGSNADQHRLDQVLKYKNIADAMEGLIGAFLVYGSAGSALAFFKYLGLPAFDPTIDRTLEIDPIEYFEKRYQNNFADTDFDDESEEDRGEIQARYQVDIRSMVANAYAPLRSVEEVIDYNFKHKYFLVQAFTHPSYTKIDTNQYNYISSYQRLEFIGDAILDYVITYYVYMKQPDMSPFQITLVRTALVNNTFYASVVVKYNLHKYLRHTNSKLTASITSFVKKFKCQMFQQLGQMVDSTIGDGEELANIDEIDVPKSLADIFEALVGAIYIDNGFNLEQVWKVVYRMIKVELDIFLKKIPHNPLAWLEKTYVNCYEFGQAVKIENSKQEMKLIIKNSAGQVVDTFMGYGTSKKQCKMSASRRAMAKLTSTENLQFNSDDDYVDDEYDEVSDNVE